jgi:hypothetical protein
MKRKQRRCQFCDYYQVGHITGRRIESPKRPFIQTTFMCDISFLQGRICTKDAHVLVFVTLRDGLIGRGSVVSAVVSVSDCGGGGRAKYYVGCIQILRK